MGRIPKLLTSRYTLAAIGGALLGCAFPKIGLSGAAWIAPAVIAGAGLGLAGWERFRVGYVAGFAYYMVGLYWLLHIPFTWMGIPIGPAAGWLGLCAYMAIYPAIWVWLVTTLAHGHPTPENRGFLNASRILEEKGFLKRQTVALFAAASWVALEMVIARMFTGFPWDLLGVSQYQMLPLIQIAAYTGVYGVSFLIIWMSVSVLMAAVMMARKPTIRSKWAVELVLPMLVIGFIVQSGMRQVRELPEASRHLKVAMVQPSIPQTLIWDASKTQERFQELLRISNEALLAQPDLLIWPESAVPNIFRGHKETYQAITSLARNSHTWMIIGADDFAPKPNAANDEDLNFFNSSFLITPEGEVLHSYNKRNLVIFGEYIPLVKWLPFLRKIVPIGDGFTAGDTSGQFVIDRLGITVAPLICFEDIFPHLGRQAAQPDTDFIINLTNNGWFGESAAQWQHAATAVFRAVENRIPLVRCTNNGLTCWIDQHGRIRRVFRDSHGSEYGPGYLLCEIPLLGPDELRSPTPYHLHGDRFGWACVIVTMLWLPIRFAPRRDSQPGAVKAA